MNNHEPTQEPIDVTITSPDGKRTLTLRGVRWSWIEQLMKDGSTYMVLRLITPPTVDNIDESIRKQLLDVDTALGHINVPKL
jgi:hypothetical protein